MDTKLGAGNTWPAVAGLAWQDNSKLHREPGLEVEDQAWRMKAQNFRLVGSSRFEIVAGLLKQEDRKPCRCFRVLPFRKVLEQMPVANRPSAAKAAEIAVSARWDL